MRKNDPDAREKIYMILSVAIMFPWLLWLIIELPYLTTIFAA